MKNKTGDIFFFVGLILVIISSQFILGYKHLQYGFDIDDWNMLAWYKQIVSNPITDFVKAWQIIGPHNFSHTYYIGVLFEFFKFNYLNYQILNTLLKVLSALSLFPVIYLLFKNKWLAFLTTFIFAVHFSHFGVLNNVLRGEDSLMIVCMNLFFAIYIWAFQNNKFNFKTMFILITLLLAASYFDITRFYPVLMLMPFIEILNFWLNKSQRNFKSSILRLLMLYSPFIALIIYSPYSVSAFSLNKLIVLFRTGNYQLFVSPFASFGSTFVPLGFIDQLRLLTRIGDGPLFRDLWTFLEYIFLRHTIIFVSVLCVMGLLSLQRIGKFILRSLFFNLLFCFFAFWASYHWQYLDLKVRIADPGTYFIPAIIGIFVFSTAISYFYEWRLSKDRFLLALSLAPIAMLLYIFLTWILVDSSSIFMGVHGYLSVVAIGTSLYLAIFLYLSFKTLLFSKFRFAKRSIAVISVIYFFFFFISSSQDIDKFYSNGVRDGYGASDQERLLNTFWNEVGRSKNYSDQNPILIYLDNYQDYDNGYFYANSFVLKIQSFLVIEGNKITHMGRYCNIQISNDDIKYIRVEIVNGKKVIISNNCGYDIIYPLENFFAFRMINRDLIPNKIEVLNALESK